MDLVGSVYDCSPVCYIDSHQEISAYIQLSGKDHRKQCNYPISTGPNTHGRYQFDNGRTISNYMLEYDRGRIRPLIQINFSGCSSTIHGFCAHAVLQPKS